MKHTTPPPDKYQIPSDNSLFKRNVVSVLYKEKKFFTQKNMPKIKAQARPGSNLKARARLRLEKNGLVAPLHKTHFFPPTKNLR